ASWIKSKSNSKSNTCQLVYTNQNGYDPLLSSLYYAKEIGDLAKSGNYFYVDKHPDEKFTLKTYFDVFADHPELFTAFYEQTRDNCEKMLDNPETAKQHEKKLLDKIRDDIHNDEDYSKSDAMDMDDIFSSLMNS